MNRKVIIFATIIFAIAVVVLGFNGKLSSGVSSFAQETTARQVPDHVTYLKWFTMFLHLKEKVDEIERQGGDPLPTLRAIVVFARKAGLNEAETAILQQIALEFDTQNKLIAFRLSTAVAAYKVQYPNGQVPSGQSAAPPPAELRQLTIERQNLVLQKRADLRSALGEESFQRMHTFLTARNTTTQVLHMPIDEQKEQQ